VEWVLDCESTKVNAFQQPDEDTIVALVRDIERTIRLWFESRLNLALLNWVDQGVIVVDENQKIERLNDAAVRILGGGIALRGHELKEFAGDDATKRLLGEPSCLPAQGMRLVMGERRGPTRSVQASVRAPEDTFGRRIWLLNEIEQEKWGIILNEMRQTVQTVAAQTRGPLLLCGALLRQAQQLVAHSDVQAVAGEVLDRAARSLARTDITYERLASSLEAIEKPQREGRLAPLSMRTALEDWLAGLPKQDQQHISLDGVPASLPSIQVDSGRMAFALRTIVGYLLAIRAPGAQIDLCAWIENKQISFKATLRSEHIQVGDDHPAAPLYDGIEQALTPARTIIERHGGHLLHQVTKDGLEVQISALPVSRDLGATTP